MGDVVYLFGAKPVEAKTKIVETESTYRKAFTDAVRPLFQHDVFTLLRHPEQERAAIVEHYAARMTDAIHVSNPNRMTVGEHACVRLHRAFVFSAENLNRLSPHVIREKWKKEMTDTVMDCASLASVPPNL